MRLIALAVTAAAFALTASPAAADIEPTCTPEINITHPYPVRIQSICVP